MPRYTQSALQHRADLVVALGNAEIAVAAQKFNKAQRRPELDVVLGATYNIADPDFTTIKAGVAMPLKFSNLNKGARLMDELLVKQANIDIEEARLIVTAEVMQAYNNFSYATKQSETFSSDMLNDMQQVVESTRKAYEMGEIPFLDYLIVQRNESEMRGEYINALFGSVCLEVRIPSLEFQEILDSLLDIAIFRVEFSKRILDFRHAFGSVVIGKLNFKNYFFFLCHCMLRIDYR